MLRRALVLIAFVAAACGTETAAPPKEKPAPDATAPGVTDLAVSPARAGKGTKVSISLNVSEEVKRLTVLVAGRSAECAQDGQAVSCSYTIAGDESEGAQTVDVRAVDLAGNAGTSSATLAIDFTAPSITFSKIPVPLSNVTTATVEFTVDDVAATVTCAVDGGAAAACTSPFTTATLTEGEHAIEVTAKDDLGNERSQKIGFTLDLTAPDTTILNTLPTLTRESSVAVTFRANDPLARFECRLDTAQFAPCTSPFTVTGYADGDHTFNVRAVDEVGNSDATPAAVAFKADLIAPETTITPVADTGAPDRSISFTVNETGATTECSVNGAAYATCTSPLELTALPDGDHSVDVVATDAAGNREALAASVTFFVDTTAPSTAIYAGPEPFTNLTAAVLQFSANEPGSVFECSLNGAAFAACTSPFSATVTDGPNRLEVAATDKYGNKDGTPARYNWNVDSTPPAVSFTSTIPTLHLQPTLTIAFEANEQTSKYECSFDGAAFADCTSPVRLENLTDNFNNSLPAHTFAVRATDLAGNVTNPPALATFDVDLSTPPPEIPNIHSPDPSLSYNSTPTFSWDPAPNATSYDYELSTDSTFTDPTKVVKSGSGVLDTSFNPDAKLANGLYYFRVRSANRTGPSDYSRTGMVEIASWRQVSPAPVDTTTNWTACKSAGNCVFVASSGYIYRTTDGGKTFRHSSRVATTTLNGVAYAGANNVVAVGSSGTLLLSEDDGISWTKLERDSSGSLLPTASLNSVHFKGDVGFAVGLSGTVLRSDDAGRTWTRVTAAPTGSHYSVQVLQTSPNIVALVGSSLSELHRTTDGGDTWSVPNKLNTLSRTLYTLSFVDANTGFVGGSSGLIMRTTDGGLTWADPTPANPSSSSINALKAIDADTVLAAVTSNGVKLIKFGATATFTDSGQQSGNSMYGVSFAGSSGFGVGSTGKVIRLDYDGTTLTASVPEGVGGMRTDSSSTGNMNAFSFPGATVGYAAGTSQNFLKTVNGGTSFQWIDVDPSGTNETFNAVDFIDSQIGWVTGQNRNPAVGTSTTYPYIAKTTDGGATWTRQALPTQFGTAAFTIYGIDFLSETVGVAVGRYSTTSNQPTLLRWDAGTSAFKFDPVVDASGANLTGSVYLYEVKLVDENTGYASGYKSGLPGVFLSYDASNQRWKNESTAFDSSSDIYSFAIVDPNVIVAVGDTGQLARRVLNPDSTVTWTSIPVTTAAGSTFTSTFNMVRFSGNTGYAVGSSKVFKSTDAGLTWTELVHPMGTSTIYSVFTLSPDAFLIGSTSRNLWRNNLGGL